MLKIDKKKLRKLEPSNNHFASLVRSIIYQQISGKAAESILNKFLKLFLRQSPKRLSGRPRSTRFSPKPEDVAILTTAKFKSAGVSPQKERYLRDLAQNFLDKKIDSKKIPKMSDDEIIEHLVSVKGIGVWTAHMFLIFALNRPDILPTGDLAIRKGFMKAFGLKKVPSEKKMIELAESHRGERTYFSLYLWGIMDEEKKK